MRKSFWVSITLGLTAFFLLPLPGQGASLSDRIEEKRDQIDQKKAREGVLSTTIARYNTRIEGLKGEISSTEDRLEARAGRPRRRSPRAPRGARQARGRTRSPRAAAGQAGRGARRPGRPPCRALQGRRARRAHGCARGRRLRRPARADRVPRADLRAGPPDRRHRAEAARPGRGAGGQARQPREARPGGGRDDPLAPRRHRRDAQPARVHARATCARSATTVPARCPT